MKISVPLLFLGIICHAASGQNLIGYKGSEIRKFMKENNPQMSINKVNNSSYNYLKYSDSSESQTLLFFLNNDSVCSSVRIICDRNTALTKKKEFDANFIKTGENNWSEKRDGKAYRIVLREEEWSSVINIQPEN